MWVDVNLLFPKAFFPLRAALAVPPFPVSRRRLTVGTLMAVNLLAAHGWRFKIQARGLRLWLGLVVMLVGWPSASHHLGRPQQQRLSGQAAVQLGHVLGGFSSAACCRWLVAAAAMATSASGGLVRRPGRQAVPWIEMVMLVLLAIPLLAVLADRLGSFAHARPSGEALRVVWQLIQGGLAGPDPPRRLHHGLSQAGRHGAAALGHRLLMFNELWVAMTARERQVFMQEGRRSITSATSARSNWRSSIARLKRPTSISSFPAIMLVANYEANQPLVKAGQAAAVHRRPDVCRPRSPCWRITRMPTSAIWPPAKKRSPPPAAV